jgi:hypothetical protein
MQPGGDARCADHHDDVADRADVGVLTVALVCPNLAGDGAERTRLTLAADPA